jgi:predicted RNA-binding protein YlxR (DUF448 family)
MPKRRPDHVPTRTCAVCRRARPKRDMTRIVRTPDGLVFRDQGGRAAGRGTYICHEASCRDLSRRAEAVKRALGTDAASEALEFEGAANAAT